MTTEQKLEAFKAEHPDAFQAIFDQGHKAGQVKGNDESLRLERERIEALASCATFNGRADFIVGQIRAGHDLGKAKGEFADLLAKENTQLRQQQSEQQRRESLANGAHEQGPDFKGASIQPRQSGGSAKLLFNQKVEAHVKAGKSKQQAINLVATEDPALYESYLEEANSSRK